MGKRQNLSSGHGKYRGAHGRIVLRQPVLLPVRSVVPDTSSARASLAEIMRIASNLLGIPSAEKIVSMMLCGSTTAEK